MSDKQVEKNQVVQSPALSQGVTVKLDYHFIKSNYFRVIHADGVWGGLTPRHDVQMAFFNERQPIPQKTTVQVTGNELKESSRQGRIGIVREMEVEVVFNIETAKAMRAWLDQMIEQHAKIQEEIEKGNIQVISQPFLHGGQPK